MNRLAEQKSPYLLQHKDNPVDWWPWAEEAFAEAKRLNKPVFLSIGYSTCHWCHVMAHESFENSEIARLMNENFINIKVDREERPDVDRLYMAFVQATTGGGGWPMSVWLTPEGRPFFGGTYFPPDNRYGRAGFPSILSQISRLWRQDREKVEGEATRVMKALASAGKGAQGAEFQRDEAPLLHGFESFSRSFDEEYGGFGGAPKFPRPSVFNFLLRFATRAAGDRANRAATMALVTLRRMAAGGMRDHLGGGFHRYSVDEYWHVPHFEKMLYDQAQLAISFVEAWQLTQDHSFADIARETLEYVSRDMTHPEGGFFSAEDADSLIAHGHPEHAEGAYYVWSRQEIVDLLGAEDTRIFCRHYGVEEVGNVLAGSDPHGEFRGKNVLIERQDVATTARILNLPADTVSRSLETARRKLFDRRAQRPRPHLDDKILTAWNGLMISAFAKAGAAFREARYLESAARAAQFLRKNLTSEGRLLRSWRGEAGAISGFAEDYAFLIQGLLDLYEAAWEVDWLEWALDLQERQDELFRDEAGGGYFGSAAGDPLVPVRMKEDYDGAEPSANSISALNLLRFARMLHDESFETRAKSILASSRDALERAPVAVPQMLVALDLALSPPAQAVVAGDRESEEVQTWNARLHREFAPRRVLLLADGNPILLERVSALASMKPLHDRAALYLCENFSCQAPQTLP
jgi:uncharacterized protein YyaL (SSP411 family)